MGSFEAIILTINHFHADIFLLSKLRLSLMSASSLFNGFTGKSSNVVLQAKVFVGASRHSLLIFWHPNLHGMPPTTEQRERHAENNKFF